MREGGERGRSPCRWTAQQGLAVQVEGVAQGTARRVMAACTGTQPEPAGILRQGSPLAWAGSQTRIGRSCKAREVGMGQRPAEVGKGWCTAVHRPGRTPRSLHCRKEAPPSSHRRRHARRPGLSGSRLPGAPRACAQLHKRVADDAQSEEHDAERAHADLHSKPGSIV